MEPTGAIEDKGERERLTSQPASSRRGAPLAGRSLFVSILMVFGPFAEVNYT